MVWGIHKVYRYQLYAEAKVILRSICILCIYILTLMVPRLRWLDFWLQASLYSIYGVPTHNYTSRKANITQYTPALRS